MAEFDLNLSTRPFPAYRLINLALASVLIVLIVLTVWQVYGFFHYSNLVRSIRPAAQALRVESETLKQSLDVLKAKLDRPESTAKLNEIGFLNGLIARKELSWTELFAHLESMVPEAVHLVSLRPEVLPDSTANLAIMAQGRSMADIKEFIEALEQSPLFEKVAVTHEDQVNVVGAGGVSVTLGARYFPEKEPR